MSEKDIVNILKGKLESKNISYTEEVWINSSVADLVINEKVAIEAKLHNINKAIYQLGAYKRKYKTCFLYMPEDKRNLVSKYEEILERMGIKWFFLNKNNQLSFGKPHWRKALFA